MSLIFLKTKAPVSKCERDFVYDQWSKTDENSRILEAAVDILWQNSYLSLFRPKTIEDDLRSYFTLKLIYLGFPACKDFSWWAKNLKIICDQCSCHFGIFWRPLMFLVV